MVDIVKIRQKDLKPNYTKPTDEEIERYYDEHKDMFLIPEKKIISFVEIDLSAYETEKAKSELSKLEDLVISSRNLDDIAMAYDVKKDKIIYSNGEENIPQDLTPEVLQYGVGTFSDVLYKDNNIYKVYYVEDIIPTKTLTLSEAKKKIADILINFSKKENELILVDKIARQIKINNIDKVAHRNELFVVKNKAIYRNNVDYPDDFVNELFELRKSNPFTETIFDKQNNVYLFGLLRDIKEIPENDPNFVSYDFVESGINRSHGNSIYKMFKKYLFDNTKITVNNGPLNVLR